MAKKDKAQKSQRPDPADALAAMERPGIKWKTVGLIAVAFAVLWLITGMIFPYVGWFGVGVSGILTLGAIGFAIYILRMTRKSAAIVDILKGATDAEGRKAALAQLEAAAQGKKGKKGKKAGGDAMNALARAQLVAQDDPGEAMKILEEVDLKKAPAVVQDDLRANLALLYLVNQRVKDAALIVPEIRLDRQPQPKAKAMYAAVIAETQARTGKAQEAKKLLETFDPADPEYGEIAPLLLRAQCHTFIATKNRGLAATAMQRLIAMDPNMVASFTLKGNHPQLTQMARQALGRAGAIPKQKVRLGKQ